MLQIMHKLWISESVIEIRVSKSYLHDFLGESSFVFQNQTLKPLFSAMTFSSSLLYNIYKFMSRKTILKDYDKN